MQPSAITPGFPLVELTQTDSTNRYLTQWCDDRRGQVPELTTVRADYQTAGKGQRGNSWESAPGCNLLFSFVLYPTFLEARRQFALSQLVSLAIKEELDGLTDSISIKWPNDIYWRDRKICGILIEHDLDGTHIGRSVAGIGLNVNQETFESDAPNPVSLLQITHTRHDLHALLCGIMDRVARYYDTLRRDTPEAWTRHVGQRYADALFRREGFHPYADAQGTFQARLLHVADDGRLTLQDDGGQLRSYLFKEVQFIV